jgi:5-methylthioadenosine/S-adenosylhomocysteine deaminase
MPPSVVGSDKAAWEIGIRAVLFPHGGDDPGMVDANETLEKSLENVQKAGDQTGKRVKIIFGFGHPNECSKEYFKKMREYATKYKVGIHGHVALNLREVSIYNEKYGKPIVEYFYETGFLADDVVFGHGTYLNPKEIKLMAQTGAKLAHNPRANMRYGSGVTPVPEMLKEGVCIGLGTDGPLSSYRIDMFEAMRFACFMQRLHKKDIGAMSAWQALELATVGGAKLLGMQEEIGSLEVGKKADLAIINLQQAHLAPLTKGRHSNIIALIVFSCSALDVETVLIDGKVVLKDCKLQTVEENQIIARVTEFAEKALEKVE